ncbi:hypothetical protein PHISCL_09239 [Aspergillus sclerotialis]|uniref:Uncharacterized protein n=1 Tax=Aspergillus sclerotialis TaxID=2070753 RepID=A0A3A2Z6W2_9EURO|nr:hypothetical protein PHISCL_09239 [Aspergillus sclerotialis]
MEADLPQETHGLFRDFEAELWNANDSARFSSMYPNFARTVHGRRDVCDETELDMILEKWNGLTVSAETQGNSGKDVKSED